MYPSIVLAAVTIVVAGGAALGCGGDDGVTAGAPTTSSKSTAPAATGGSSGDSTVNGAVVARSPSDGGRPSAPTSGSNGSTPTSSAGSGPAGSGQSNSAAAAGASGGVSSAAAGTAAASGGAPAVNGGNGDGGASAGSVNSGGSAVCGPPPTIPPAMLGEQGPMANGAPTFKNLGPFKPMHVEGTGPTGASWIFFPEDFGKDGMKHPVFLWGPGAGTGPSNYRGYLDLFASYGIVTICQPSTNSGTQALDWILKENETTGSMFFGKLDADRVARGGHSMGALLSMSEAKDDRLKATVLVCGGAGGGGGAADITYPSIFLGATGEGGTQNFRGDFAEVKGPSLFVTVMDSDHVACGRDNMAPWLAFLRWRLCDEEALWKKEFMAGGTFCTGKWEACMEKNF